MWEDGGIKIKRTRGRSICLSKLCDETAVPENFQWKNFLGLVPTESLPTQDSENVFGLGDQASASKL